MKSVITEVRKLFQGSVDEKTLGSGQHFFKEKVLLYGVRIPLVNKISKECFERVKEIPREELYVLCEELWQSGYLEEALVACNWSYYVREAYQPTDFDVFEKWIGAYVSNWASCDTLCNHTVGTFMEMYPRFVGRLTGWTGSSNRWMKRAAAVTLIIPARKGLFLEEIFRIADILLMDRDDLVQKGYGWMLKAASEAHRDKVFHYVMERKATMPRTALRYAIEKMPPEMRAEAMIK